MRDYQQRTSSTDASEAALQGSKYWYDSGTEENSAAVLYDSAGVYAHWYDGSAYLITVVADVGGSPTDYYEQSASTLTGNGSWTGTLTISSTLITDAWYRAEEYAFESLREFLGCTEGVDCYRGFLPVEGDTLDPSKVNVWQMESGGSGGFDMERVQGNSSLWCSLRVDATLNSLWENRDDAMEFAGLVMAWLKETGNFNETGNINYCNLTEIPAPPEEYITKGMNPQRYWRQEVPLEMVLKTESVY